MQCEENKSISEKLNAISGECGKSLMQNEMTAKPTAQHGAETTNIPW